MLCECRHIAVLPLPLPSAKKSPSMATYSCLWAPRICFKPVSLQVSPYRVSTMQQCRGWQGARAETSDQVTWAECGAFIMFMLPTEFMCCDTPKPKSQPMTCFPFLTTGQEIMQYPSTLSTFCSSSLSCKFPCWNCYIHWKLLNLF